MLDILQCTEQSQRRQSLPCPARPSVISTGIHESGQFCLQGIFYTVLMYLEYTSLYFNVNECAGEQERCSRDLQRNFLLYTKKNGVCNGNGKRNWEPSKWTGEGFLEEVMLEQGRFHAESVFMRGGESRVSQAEATACVKALQQVGQDISDRLLFFSFCLLLLLIYVQVWSPHWIESFSKPRPYLTHHSILPGPCTVTRTQHTLKIR